jgi:hypothetical protein
MPNEATKCETISGMLVANETTVTPTKVVDKRKYPAKPVSFCTAKSALRTSTAREMTPLIINAVVLLVKIFIAKSPKKNRAATSRGSIKKQKFHLLIARNTPSTYGQTNFPQDHPAAGVGFLMRTKNMRFSFLKFPFSS